MNPSKNGFQMRSVFVWWLLPPQSVFPWLPTVSFNLSVDVYQQSSSDPQFQSTFLTWFPLLSLTSHQCKHVLLWACSLSCFHAATHYVPFILRYPLRLIFVWWWNPYQILKDNSHYQHPRRRFSWLSWDAFLLSVLP